MGHAQGKPVPRTISESSGHKILLPILRQPYVIFRHAILMRGEAKMWSFRWAQSGCAMQVHEEEQRWVIWDLQSQDEAGPCSAAHLGSDELPPTLFLPCAVPPWTDLEHFSGAELQLRQKGHTRNTFKSVKCFDRVVNSVIAATYNKDCVY